MTEDELKNWEWFSDRIDTKELENLSKEQLLSLIETLNDKMIESTINWEGG